MQQIRPVAELRSKIGEITHEVVDEQRPVILTKNGRGHMVLMSYAEYARLTSMREIYDAIDEGIAAANAGKVTDAKEFMLKVREDITNGRI